MLLVKHAYVLQNTLYTALDGKCNLHCAVVQVIIQIKTGSHVPFPLLKISLYLSTYTINSLFIFFYRAEFKVVYNGIYSDEIEPKRQAMEKMLSWQSRYTIVFGIL